MEKSYKWGSSGFGLGPIAFSYLYKQRTHDSDSKVVLFACDTSIIMTRPNQEGLKTALNRTLSNIISWFKANFPSLNFSKMYYLQF